MDSLKAGERRLAAGDTPRRGITGKRMGRLLARQGGAFGSGCRRQSGSPADAWARGAGVPGAMSLPGPVPDDRSLFAIDRKAAGHGNTEIAGRAALPAANVIGLTW